MSSASDADDRIPKGEVAETSEHFEETPQTAPRYRISFERLSGALQN